MIPVALQPTYVYNEGTMLSKNCKWCHGEYSIYPYQMSRSSFCGMSCRGSWLAVNRLNKNIHLRDYKGSKNPCWRGGRFTRPDGYVMVYMPDNPNTADGTYIMEHRFVMEEFLKRPLRSGEVVHHRNGIRSDNRVENLEILEGQSEHAKLHDSKRSKNIRGQYI